MAHFEKPLFGQYFQPACVSHSAGAQQEQEY